MDYILNVDGIICHVKVKKVKYLSISIAGKDGKVRVSAPEGIDRKKVESFIFLKKDWIRKKQWEIQAHCLQAAPEFVEMAQHPVWGKLHCLRIHPYSSHNNVVCQNFNLHLYIRGAGEQNALAAMLEAWRKLELTREACKRMPFWQNKMGLPEIALSARRMKSRWGSCHINKNRIVLNTVLTEKDTKCLEYVIVHELAHFFVPNHGKKFHLLLDKYLPDWRETRKVLNASESGN